MEHRFQDVWAQQLRFLGSRAQAQQLCSAWAQLLHGMWNLPRPRMESMSPALVSLTTPYHSATREALKFCFCVFMLQSHIVICVLLMHWYLRLALQQITQSMVVNIPNVLEKEINSLIVEHRFLNMFFKISIKIKPIFQRLEYGQGNIVGMSGSNHFNQVIKVINHVDVMYSLI